MRDSDALPPPAAVPVESPLIERLFATREWVETEALLAEDFAWFDERGKRRRAKHLQSATRWAEAAVENPHATLETIVADLEEPTVLYARGRTRTRALYRAECDIDTIMWTRVVITSCGTRIRELGPSIVVGRRQT
jgi:hypothetical protein